MLRFYVIIIYSIFFVEIIFAENNTLLYYQTNTSLELQNYYEQSLNKNFGLSLKFENDTSSTLGFIYRGLSTISYKKSLNNSLLQNIFIIKKYNNAYFGIGLEFSFDHDYDSSSIQSGNEAYLLNKYLLSSKDNYGILLNLETVFNIKNSEKILLAGFFDLNLPRGFLYKSEYSSSLNKFSHTNTGVATYFEFNNTSYELGIGLSVGRYRIARRGKKMRYWLTDLSMDIRKNYSEIEYLSSLLLKQDTINMLRLPTFQYGGIDDIGIAGNLKTEYGDISPITVKMNIENRFRRLVKLIGLISASRFVKGENYLNRWGKSTQLSWGETQHRDVIKNYSANFNADIFQYFFKFAFVDLIIDAKIYEINNSKDYLVAGYFLNNFKIGGVIPIRKFGIIEFFVSGFAIGYELKYAKEYLYNGISSNSGVLSDKLLKESDLIWSINFTSR